MCEKKYIVEWIYADPISGFRCSNDEDFADEITARAKALELCNTKGVKLVQLLISEIWSGKNEDCR